MNVASSNMNGISLNIAGSCSLCGKQSECKCDRCGDFYCSEYCQRKDWGSHRYICFPMPKLVKAVPCLPNIQNGLKSEQRIITKETKSQNQIPNGSCVKLTSFKSTNRCYVYSTNPSSVAEYNKILNEINEFGKTSPALTNQPKIGSHVIASRNGKWCRGKNLGMAGAQQRILFSDFGDLGKRNINELRKIEPHINSLPCLLQMVQLKGIKNMCTETKVVNELAQFANQEYKIVFSQPDKSIGEVELFKWGTDILLNDLVKNLNSKCTDDAKDNESVASSLSNVNSEKQGTTTDKSCSDINLSKIVIGDESKKLQSKFHSPREQCKAITGDEAMNAYKDLTNKTCNVRAPRQIQKPCLVPPFDNIPMNETDKSCEILIMDNSYIESGYIGCLLQKYYDNLKSISKFLKEYNINDEFYKPKLNEYCLANYEHEWYRARVVEILSEDKFLVVYIDFTNEMALSSESIRRYPMSLNFPCCTTLCAIDGLPSDIPDKMQRFLEENCTPFQHLTIDSVRVEGNIRYVKSNVLLAKLRDAELL